MYLLSSDNWLRENMYHAYECGAWYSSAFPEGDTKEWCLTFQKKGRISDVKVGGRDSWVMYGPAYFSREFTARFMPVLKAYYELPGTEQFYWEQVYVDMLSGEAVRRIGAEDEALLARTAAEAGVEPERWDEIEMDINRQPDDQVYEFENLEELRVFDTKYQNHSDNEALKLVSRVFEVPESEIHDIRCLKAGMTNKSFLFQVEGKHCICRIPGPGTELLVNRRQEKAVYDAVAPLGITEHLIYLNPETGYKIADYYEGPEMPPARTGTTWRSAWRYCACCTPAASGVDHEFDIRERIDFYEALCKSHGGFCSRITERSGSG